MPDTEIFKERIREALRLAKQNGYTQAKIGERAGVSPQAVGQWPRSGKVSTKNLAILAHLAGKPLEWFGLDLGIPALKRLEQEVDELAALASPRSEAALQYIAQAAREGRLTEDDLLMLERIAQRIAAQPDVESNRHNKMHQRLKDKLGNNDSSTER